MMGESVGVSVSFGKYENDAALSWEKWSTFSPNKYLEEVGKCSTPGSVAQKKAFFEAHYKKIAAMKLAQAEADEHQQHGIEAHHSTSQEIQEQHADFTQILDAIDGSGDGDKPVEQQQEEEEESIQVGNFEQSLNSSNAAAAAEKLEEAVLVNVESLVKQHFQVDLEGPPHIPKPKNVAPKKLNGQQVAPPTPNKVEKTPIGIKKKTASLVPKSPETPATKLSNSKPKVKPKPTSASPLKKASAPSVSSSKNKVPSLSEGRRVSLHLSMSMSSVNSDTASSVTSSRRRSLFMEQMGDKDIVKRAFKTFQNRVNQLPTSDTGPKQQLPTKRSDQKTWTYQKENERSRKAAAAEKINPARGPTWKSGSLGVDERRLKAGPTSVALKSHERAERRKEFLKKLEEKSNARAAERSQLSLKSKEAEMTKVRQKAKPMPKVLKST